ncbi:restriction endonuclease subunit S [Flavitalea sp.]|nr:restriction endonuclease subunit S [Flavitalea sp.]
MSSKDWGQFRLGDICLKIGSGATPRGGKESYSGTGEFALIRSQNVLDFSFSYDGLAFIDQLQASKLNNVIVERDDILLNITGDSVARVCQVPKEISKARVNQHVAIIRPQKDILDNNYLKYYLLNPSFKNYMLALSSVGGTRNALTKVMIEDFRITLPPIVIQRQIAFLLSSIDDKIELNRQMNQTLEAIAQGLFKEWFVDFNFPDFDGTVINGLPQGWKKILISDISSNIQYGLTQSSTLENVGPKFLRITDIQGGIVNWSKVPNCIATEKDFKKYKINAHDIFIARTGASTGENIYVVNPPTAVFASYLIRVQFENPALACYVGKFLRGSEYFNFISSILSGSAQPNANAKQLTSIEIVLPTNEILDKYFIIVNSLNQKKELNANENETLANLRDTLLPKLMTGEVSMPQREKRSTAAI